MKLKKLLTPLLLFCMVLFAMAGCTHETELADMEITKIETSWREGFAPFAGSYVRTFDFKKGKVYDTLVTDKDISEIPSHLGLTAKDLNNPKQIATFTQEQAETLYEYIKSLGFFAWEEKYVTSDIVNDAGDSRVSVCFPNGTVKSTKIYCEYPPNYSEIRDAFEEYLGVNFYYNR